MLCRPVTISLLCLMLHAVPALAQEQSYTITVSGLKAGTLTVAANSNGSSYAVTSRAASAGLAGLFRSFSITSRVSGTQSGGTLRPLRYVSQSEGARAGRSAELTFQDGTPTVVNAASEPAPDAPKVDPASLTNVVDPLTGLYAILRDTAMDDVCTLDLSMFDGHRVSRVTLSGPRQTDDGLECSGVYRRVAGYPPKDLAERQSFPFTVVYSAEDAGAGRLHAKMLTMDSLFGPARMIRD
jgi:hypothetical protein